MNNEIIDKQEIIKRMANPTKPSDYGLSITYSNEEERDLIFKEIENERTPHEISKLK